MGCRSDAEIAHFLSFLPTSFLSTRLVHLVEAAAVTMASSLLSPSAQPRGTTSPSLGLPRDPGFALVFFSLSLDHDLVVHAIHTRDMGRGS